MILSGFAVQVNGFGSALVSATNRLMAAWRSTTDRKTPRFSRRRLTSSLEILLVARPPLSRVELIAAGFLQCRKIGLRQLPYDRRRDVFIIVAQHVADRRYLLPRDIRMACFHLIRQMPARLGNNLNPALDKPLPLPIGFELLERYILQHAMNAFDRLDDVCQTRNERPGCH